MGSIYKGGVYREMTAAEEAENAAIDKKFADALPAVQAKASRMLRDARLATCDWTQAADSPLTASKKTAWANYRAALRNLPTADEKRKNREKISWSTAESHTRS